MGQARCQRYKFCHYLVVTCNFVLISPREGWREREKVGWRGNRRCAGVTTNILSQDDYIISLPSLPVVPSLLSPFSNCFVFLVFVLSSHLVLSSCHLMVRLLLGIVLSSYCFIRLVIVLFCFLHVVIVLLSITVKIPSLPFPLFSIACVCVWL
jgi:hypothetical protein